MRPATVHTNTKAKLTLVVEAGTPLNAKARHLKAWRLPNAWNHTILEAVRTVVRTSALIAGLN
jgi:hypothetical protein